MTDSVTITIPLPPKGCSPNVSAHWAAKARARKQLKKWAYVAVKEATACLEPRWPTATAQIRWYAKAAAWIPDPDNAIAALKGAFDGVQSAGLIENDKYLTPLPPIFGVDRDDPRVELTLEQDNG